MTSVVSARSVSQPTHLTIPERASSAGQEAVDLAQSAGLVLDPWQAEFLDVALSERPDGKWATRQVGLIVPRQNGKGAILEALELACLFLFGDKLILHSAHEFKTATEAFLRIRFLIENTPDLDRRVRSIHQNNNDMSIELRTRQRLRFVARSGGSGRGFSGDKIILDEAYNLGDKMVSALGPTMRARKNPQVWFTSSAPLEEPCSNVLRRIAKRGRSGDPTLAYAEYCSDDDADLDSRQAWGQANPNYSGNYDYDADHHITEEAVVSDRSLMTDEDFARECCGIWDADLEDAARIISKETWDACRAGGSKLEGTARFAMEVAPDRSWASFAVAGDSSVGGRTHVKVIRYEPGTDWVVAGAKTLQEKWGVGVVVAAHSAAMALVPDLEAAGVDVTVLTSAEQAAATGLLLDRATNVKIAHLDQPELNTAVTGAGKRDNGEGADVLSSRRSTCDISPLKAVTWAMWQAIQAPEPTGEGFVMVLK
jgi:hypothetical protein